MTGEEMVQAMRVIGWNSHELARRLRIHDRRLRRMQAGTEEIPEAMARWLMIWAQAASRLPQLPEGWVVRRSQDRE